MLHWKELCARIHNGGIFGAISIYLSNTVVFSHDLIGRRVAVDIAEILSAALFCFSMVFALLGGLYISVKLSTSAIRIIETKAKK